jgi:GntR family transcriptional regulator/MocR family aminotransferase
MRPGISVDPASSVPLRVQLASALRHAILSGQLHAGERIPSSRELRMHLGVSRNTVVDALEQLHSEGYLTTQHGVGTFVAASIQRSHEQRKRAKVRSGRASAAGQRCLEVRALAENLHVSKPFRPGLPALDLFPAAHFARAFRPDDPDTPLLDYPDPQGHEPLREAIVQRLRQTRGICADANQVFITSGAQSAFAIVAHVLLERGDAAAIEDPGYPNARAVLHAYGASLIAVPVDEAGIDISALSRRRARLVYVTPSHQYPTGAVLSLERRLALLNWAQKCGAFIVEDDYDSEFNYTGRPQPALFGLAGAERVIYAGTFSKVLSPALRLGYVLVPHSLRRVFSAVQMVSGSGPDTFVQTAVAGFMQSGRFGRHIAAMRRVYDERRKRICAELEAIGGLSIRDSRAGLHLIAELPRNVRDDKIFEDAWHEGIIVPALSSYFYGTPTRKGLVIGYAATAPPQAKTAMGVLERVLHRRGVV